MNKSNSTHVTHSIITDSNGSKNWYQNGKYNSVDSKPAIECTNGSKQWHENIRSKQWYDNISKLK